jgi:hypothetical protein
MNTLADRVRAAAEATAQEIKPDSIRDWHELAIHSSSGRERAALTRRRHARTRWLAPLTAAVAVLAVVVASAMLAAGHSGRPGPAPEPASGSGALPPYYVELQQLPAAKGGPAQNWPRDKVVVRSSATGARLATIAPPRGYATFDGLQGTGNDGLFLLAAIRPSGRASLPVTRFYALRIRPPAAGEKLGTLTPLAAPVVPAGSSVLGSGLSPDGRMLAVVGGGGNSSRLRVYDLATGASRSWPVPSAGLYVPPEWTADNRTLALQFDANQLLLVHTAARGGSLNADSTVVHMRVPPGASQLEALGLTLNQVAPVTADGQHLIQEARRGGKSLPTLTHVWGMYVLNLRTGTGRWLRPEGEPPFVVMWVSPSGNAAIVRLWENDQAFLWTARNTTPISSPPEGYAVAW